MSVFCKEWVVDVQNIAVGSKHLSDGILDVQGELARIQGGAVGGRICQFRDDNDICGKIVLRCSPGDHQDVAVIGKRLHLLLDHRGNATGFEMIMEEGNLHCGLTRWPVACLPAKKDKIPFERAQSRRGGSKSANLNLYIAPEHKLEA